MDRNKSRFSKTETSNRDLLFSTSYVTGMILITLHVLAGKSSQLPYELGMAVCAHLV